MTWEKRWHPLLREWVAITSHRNSRPWSTGEAPQGADGIPAYQPDCYLCPGNTRVSGANNPEYSGVFVFDNDHPSFSLTAPPALAVDEWFAVEPAYGKCRVVCYAPEHNRSLSRLTTGEIEALLFAWRDESRELARDPRIRQVFVFENRGEVVGASNPHPHCQIYAVDYVMETLRRELASVAAYREEQGGCLFTDLIAAETRDARRILHQDDDATAFVPYFARFPYETYIVPHAAAPDLVSLSDAQLAALAVPLQNVLTRYDNLWRSAFPYILTIHQAPCNSGEQDYRVHLQIHPPMRAPGLQKFLAGTETGGGAFMNDGSPEDKAAELLAVPGDHFL